MVESKGINTQLKIENGQWSFLQKEKWKGMADPIEQNARHILVLREILRDFNWLPRTLGIPVVPRFINVVVVPPECLISQTDGLTWVLHMDQLVTKARWDFGFGNLLVNLIHNHDHEVAQALGRKLVAIHHPGEIDYRKRFGIKGTRPPPNTAGTEIVSTTCDGCGKIASVKEVLFCRNQAKRFAGKVLCRKCQVPTKAPAHRLIPTPPPAGDRCAECNKQVSSGVIKFCRERSERFGGRVLCMSCQRDQTTMACQGQSVRKSYPL